jgi:hypothetical protein
MPSCATPPAPVAESTGKDHQMNDHIRNQNGKAVSRWEDDGGARRDSGRLNDKAREPGDRRRSEQERLDASHQSDTRGEHRYDDVHQTGAEKEARQRRDDLKQRLAGRVARH